MWWCFLVGIWGKTGGKGEGLCLKGKEAGGDPTQSGTLRLGKRLGADPGGYKTVRLKTVRARAVHSMAVKYI